jgi:hypothetical protein
MRATCDSCGAEIEWARFDKSGKAVPLDVGLVDNGNLELVRRGGDGTPYMRLLGRVEVDDARIAGRPLRRTHFVSCPNAAAHRRPRAGAPST